MLSCFIRKQGREGAGLTCFRVRKGQEAHGSVQETQSEVRIENWLLSKFFCL